MTPEELHEIRWRQQHTKKEHAIADRSALLKEVDRLTVNREKARVHLAWLIWCFNEGYTKVADRVGMGNWLDDYDLIEQDGVVRDDLLAMADEILALL